MVSLNTQLIYSQWTQTGNTGNGHVYSLAVIGSNIFAGTNLGVGYYNNVGVYLSTNTGTTWTQVMNGIGYSDIIALAASGIYIFAANNGYHVFRSSNLGTSWIAVDSGLNRQSLSQSFAVSGINLFVSNMNGGVYLSTNNGDYWTQLNVGSNSNYIVNALIANGTNVFASANGVYRSTNNGTNWEFCNFGTPGQTVQAFAACGTNVFAGTFKNGVYLSTNNGTNWTQVNNGLTNTRVCSFTMVGTNIFVGTNSGVFLSTDNGSLWNQVGLEAEAVVSLAVSGDYIYAGTWGAGVWKRPLSELVGVNKEANDLPKDYTLSQNFPNPFNPNTVISYSLPSASNVKLIVYNTLGQTVKVLENGHKNEGTHSVNFNAAELSSGTYFYKIEAGQFSQIKKMIFLK
jgi:photosystem II stability/assembly factor-like uncharacterized protein